MTESPLDIRLKRIYEPADASDGRRVLVERLWPRGVTKEAAALDRWVKELAPSPELRTWFGHAPERWPGFVERYRAELEEKEDEIGSIVELARHGPVTFVFAARDPERNSAALLREYISARWCPEGQGG